MAEPRSRIELSRRRPDSTTVMRIALLTGLLAGLRTEPVKPPEQTAAKSDQETTGPSRELRESANERLRIITEQMGNMQISAEEFSALPHISNAEAIRAAIGDGSGKVPEALLEAALPDSQFGYPYNQLAIALALTADHQESKVREMAKHVTLEKNQNGFNTVYHNPQERESGGIRSFVVSADYLDLPNQPYYYAVNSYSMLDREIMGRIDSGKPMFESNLCFVTNYKAAGTSSLEVSLGDTSLEVGKKLIIAETQLDLLRALDADSSTKESMHLPQ